MQISAAPPLLLLWLARWASWRPRPLGCYEGLASPTAVLAGWWCCVRSDPAQTGAAAAFLFYLIIISLSIGSFFADF
jgi:hypothetical protein